jgi:hypothetical protein
MTEQQNKYLNIELKLSEENKTMPIITDFSMNRPTTESLSSNDFLHLFKRKNKQDYKIVGERNNIQYDGRSKNNSSEGQKYFIAIFNNKKRTLTFTQANYMTITHNTKLLEHNKVTENQNITPSTYVENKSLLVQDFGTSKSKKVIDSMRSNIVKEENISSLQAMHNIINQKSKDEEEQAKVNQVNGLLSGEQSMIQILPKFNLETKDEFEIFDLDSSKSIL